MQKKILLPLLLVALSFNASGIEVSVSDECGTGASFVSLNDTEGGHVAEPSYYDNKVCVQGAENLEIQESCREDENSALGLFQRNNSHATTYDNEYLLQVCARSIKTRYDSSCRENETKMLSLSRRNNSHVAAPTYADSTYNGSLCGSYDRPENVTLELSGLETPIRADEEPISTGETFYPPVDYPYIASENIGIVNYGSFLKLSRPEENTVSMTQEERGDFIIPKTQEVGPIERRRDEVVQRELLEYTSPNFGYSLNQEPLVKVAYQPSYRTNVSEIPRRGEIILENIGLVRDELTLEIRGR